MNLLYCLHCSGLLSINQRFSIHVNAISNLPCVLGHYTHMCSFCSVSCSSYYIEVLGQSVSTEILKSIQTCSIFKLLKWSQDHTNGGLTKAPHSTSCDQIRHYKRSINLENVVDFRVNVADFQEYEFSTGRFRRIAITYISISNSYVLQFI